MVVQPHIASYCYFEVVPASRVVGARDGDNAAVVALDHAVGLGPARRDDAVLDAELGAASIEAVLPAWLTLAVGSEAVGEFLGVVGQDRLGLERGCLVQHLEKALGRTGTLIGHQLHINPARGAIDGHKGVAPLVLVAHLGRVLDFDVHEARHVGLEGLAGPGRDMGFLRQLGDAMASQHPIQRRAAHLWGNELARNCQQIVQRQAQLAAEIQHQRSLPVVEVLGEPIRRVTAIRPPSTFGDAIS